MMSTAAAMMCRSAGQAGRKRRPQYIPGLVSYLLVPDFIRFKGI